MFKADEQGQAMTEFLIVFPVFMLMFLCIWQFVEIARAQIFVEYAAFTAARSATVYGTDEHVDMTTYFSTLPLDDDAVSLYRSVMGDGTLSQGELQNLTMDALGEVADVFMDNVMDDLNGYFQENFGFALFDNSSPGPAAFNPSWDLINGNTVQAEVTYNFPLKLPLLKEFWEATTTRYEELADEGRVEGRENPELDGMLLLSARCFMGLEAHDGAGSVKPWDGEYRERYNGTCSSSGGEVSNCSSEVNSAQNDSITACQRCKSYIRADREYDNCLARQRQNPDIDCSGFRGARNSERSSQRNASASASRAWRAFNSCQSGLIPGGSMLGGNNYNFICPSNESDRDAYLSRNCQEMYR